MPRQDIHIDEVYGEVTTTDNLTNKVIHDFTLLGRVEGADNDLYVFITLSWVQKCSSHNEM